MAQALYIGSILEFMIQPPINSDSIRFIMIRNVLIFSIIFLLFIINTFRFMVTAAVKLVTLRGEHAHWALGIYLGLATNWGLDLGLGILNAMWHCVFVCWFILATFLFVWDTQIYFFLICRILLLYFWVQFELLYLIGVQMLVLAVASFLDVRKLGF